MSLLEWFFESANPGPVGKIKINRPKPDGVGDEPPKNWFAYLAAALGLTLVCAILYWAFNNLLREGAVPTITKLGCFGLYIVVSYLVNPSPDTNNIGWMGGLINNPFRISDNFNRALLLIQVMLVPGKVMGYCLFAGWAMAWRFCRKLRL